MSATIDNPFPTPQVNPEYRQWDPDEWDRFSIVRQSMFDYAHRSGQQHIQDVVENTRSVPIYPFSHKRTLVPCQGKVINTESNIEFISDPNSQVGQFFDQIGIPRNSIPLSDGRFVWFSNKGWMRQLGWFTGNMILVDADFACRTFDGVHCIFHELAHACGMDEEQATIIQIDFIKIMIELNEERHRPKLQQILASTELTLNLLRTQ